MGYEDEDGGSRTSFTLAMLVGSALILSGCAGVTDSFISFDQPVMVRSAAQPGFDAAAFQRDLAAAKYADLEAALGYAEAAKAKLSRAVINQGRLGTWTGAALIPAGALALGLGTIGGQPTTAAVLGLGASGVMGTALWLRNRPAQAAYLEGYKAVNCAIEAVLPLRVARADNPDYQAFRAARDALPADLASLESAIVEVADAIADPAFARDSQLSRAQRELPIAQGVAAAGREALSAATGVTLLLDQAAGRLVTTVDRIESEVSTAVLANQADIASLPAILGGLGQSYGAVTPPATANGAERRLGGERSFAESGGLDTLLADLQRAAQPVAARTQVIAAFTGALAEAKPVEALKACGVDPASFAGGLTVDPPGPFSFTAGQAARQGFLVAGGTEPYAAELPDAPPGLTARPLQAFGATFVIELTAEVPAGSYLLVAQDRGGHKRTARIVVAPATAPPVGSRGTGSGTGGGSGAGLTPDDPVFAALPNDAGRRQLQRALCLVGDGPQGADGRWGPNTSDKLGDYQRKQPAAAVTGTLTDDIARDLLGETPGAILERCGVPVAADIADLRDTQARLEKENPDLAVRWANDGLAGFTVRAAKLLPERNQIEATLVVNSPPRPASDGSRLRPAEVRTALRHEIERVRQIPSLVDENFVIRLRRFRWPAGGRPRTVRSGRAKKGRAGHGRTGTERARSPDSADAAEGPSGAGEARARGRAAAIPGGVAG